MSGVKATKRVLKTTVAAAAAGVVAFVPMVPMAQAPEARVAATSPVEIRVGANRGFTKIEFAGSVGARARVRQEGQFVIVRIGTSAAPDIGRLRVDPPKGVEKVETRAVAGVTELVMTLAQGASIRSGSADGAVWVNLFPPSDIPPVRERPSAVPAGGSVPITAQVTDGVTRLSFNWAQPVAAAVFRRGEAAWIVFDVAAGMKMPSADKAPSVANARWAAGPDFTAIRIPLPEGQSLSARAEGSTWIVSLGGLGTTISGIEVDRDETAATAMTARVAGASRAIWLTDPMVGDRFAAVTALGPGKGLTKPRRTMELTLLPTAQGLAVESRVDDLSIKADGDIVTLTRPKGLALSSAKAGLDEAEASLFAPRAAQRPALILSDWADMGTEGFNNRYRALQDAALAEGAKAKDSPRTPIEARLALARFLVGNGLGFEAVGVLNALIRQTPSMQGVAEVRGLRGAARASIGRFAEAEADFSSNALAGDPSTRLWQGYIAAQSADWATARQNFAAGASVVDNFSPEWRVRFATSHAMSAVETGDLEGARELLSYIFAQPDIAPLDQLAARLVQARLYEALEKPEPALMIFKAVARTPMDAISTPARLGVIRLELAKGAMKPDAAAAQLEGLKWRWRGDQIELAVIRSLADLYLSQGRYREALTTLKAAGHKIITLPGGGQLKTDLDNAFRAMFLEGAADGLQPVQALALFFDFRELTPVGADGDEMVRRLARRLIDVDLLEQAAELLKYQADNRLDGVAKAQVASNLAAVYLMNRQPEEALQALWTSRTTLLPTAIQAERRALEARALTELGRYDHALEILGNDNSAAARDVRAEILWKQQSWGPAATLYEAQLGERHKDTTTPLTADEENRLIRAGVGFSLAKNAAALARLSRNYSVFADRSRSPGSLRLALAGLDGMDGLSGARDLASLSAAADTYAGWITQTKSEFRARTASSTPAAPASASARAAAPAAAPATAPAAS